MDVKLRVRRYDPEAADPKPYWQDFDLEVEHFETVLDVLIRIREEIDGTLGLRCSCRSAICGSCAMRIDGHAKLACKTKIVDLVPEGGQVTVEPVGNMPVVKDLIADMKPFWDKIRAVDPWLQPEGPPPQREYIVPNEAMQELSQVMNCIMCGACVSDCTTLEAELKMGKPVEKTWLAPAALAKAYRFVGDPRDDHQYDRLVKLSEPGGIWDCTHCFECIEVCPKGVAPMDQIMKLRERAVEADITDNNGSRHATAFANSVRNYGRLDELTLVPRSVGIFNVRELIPQMPTALRMLKAGKLRLPHRVENRRKIREIFDKTAKEELKEE